MINHNRIKSSGSQNISLQKRIEFINNYPIFCLLTANALHELASLLNEIYIQKDETIVSEGDDFDGFFLIVSGTAVVSRTLKRVQKTNAKLLATLGPNRAIGLGNTGYFSKQGKRSATVTSLSSMVLLHIDLLRFYSFLKAHAPVYPSLISISEKFLLHQYFKDNRGKHNKFTLFASQQMLLQQNNDKNILNELLDIEDSISAENRIMLLETKLSELGFYEDDLTSEQSNPSRSFIKSLMRTITNWRKGKAPREQKK